MEPQKNNTIKEYLPSKQFTARVVIIIILCVLAIGVYKITLFVKAKLGTRGQTALLVKPDVIQKDSNNNGIPDWEESLWGLDPKKDGASNKEFIIAKREALARENGTSESTNEPLSENETLAREFFSIIMSLQESGNLDDTAMKSVGDTIGEKIVATPIKDSYTSSMLLTIKANPATTETYFSKMSDLMEKYSETDMGKELTFISVGLTHNDPQALSEAGKVALSYRGFGREALKIQVPNTLSNIHLSIINNYEKVAQSIEGMTVMLDDPIAGMKAIVNYKKYSDALASDIETLSNSLD